MTEQEKTVNPQGSKTKPKISNRLLAALPTLEYESIRPKLEKVPLSFGSEIYRVGNEIGYVYFPNSGIISLLAAVESSSTLEVGIVGREGIAGISILLGVKTSGVKAIVQGEGSTMRMTAANFETECRRDGFLRQVLLRFTHSLLTQISQSAVCFRFHQIELRLARWLLMMNDRMESTEFEMTQDFLSQMLGVRREAVNRAARSLQDRGLISYRRSNILIIDRPSLENAACQCYAILRDEQESAYRQT